MDYIFQTDICHIIGYMAEEGKSVYYSEDRVLREYDLEESSELIRILISIMEVESKDWHEVPKGEENKDFRNRMTKEEYDHSTFFTNGIGDEIAFNTEVLYKFFG